MSSSYLEQLRFTLSQIEVLEKTIVFCMQSKQVIPNQSVLLEHRINNLLQMIQKGAADALILIDGADGWKKEEMNYLSGNGGSGDVWENFYDRYKEIKEYHKKAGNVQIPQNKVDFYFEQSLAPPFKEPYFSGEEHHGRYLDLHSNYKDLLNLKKIKESKKVKIGDYLWYLQNFWNFHEIPQFLKEKEKSKYKRYLTNLLDYLRNFYLRVNPLLDTGKIEQQIENEFNRLWDNGLVKGWNGARQEKNDAQELSHFCQVCNRKFTNENTFISHYQGKKHKSLAKLREKQVPQQENGQNIKGADQQAHSCQDDTQQQESQQLQEQPLEQFQARPQDQLERNDVPNNHEDDLRALVDNTIEKQRKLAYLEIGINVYREAVQQQINDTMNLVRKKQSRGYDENDDDEQVVPQNPEQEQPDEVSSDDESPIYNPKNLPLGWDGRPIPYWLYKLHGLGVEYKCEICGNTSYWGRKAFEDHFQGWRHSYGMRCLKIPNTLHFKEITKIQDAINLYKKIQIDQERSRFRPEYEEEYEDTDGNLLNKKMYYDLKKQGLL